MRSRRTVIIIMSLAAIGLAGVAVPAPAQSPPEDAHSLCLPTGPPPKGGYEPYVGGVLERGQKVIDAVPPYLWRHGCGPTAAGMVIGYWDGQAFGHLIPGDASTQTNEVDQAIATGNGPNTHYSDYSLPIDDPDVDPQPLPDLSEPPPGDEHPSDCLGDFMETSWSAANNYYGWSWFSHVDDALVGYTDWANMTYGASYEAASWGETWGTFTWEKFRQEIDNDRPMVFLVDSDGNGQTDHFVTAIGYRDTNGYPEYACFDTWSDDAYRWERFREMSGSYPWGIYGATYCAVQWRNIGSIVPWGDNEYGQCNVPVPNADFVAVAAGDGHSLGLKADGSIRAWGYDEWGLSDVPLPNAAFMAVAAGWYHSLGLKADGWIVTWGYNYSGQCDVPQPNTAFVAVAGGLAHSLGLKADGSIVAWGSNYYGQGDVPAPNTDFVAVAAGGQHSLGLKADATIRTWGLNDDGQCDVPGWNANFVAVAGGFHHSLGLKADGSIVAWGYNGYGQCDVPAPNTDFVAVAGGAYYSLGLKADGSIVAWGSNGNGQCDVPRPNTDFVAVAGGGSHSLGLIGYATPPADLNAGAVVEPVDLRPTPPP